MKLIIVWDQVVACWKMQKDITFCRDKLSVIVHLSPQLINQKQGFNQHGGINQTTNRAQETPGATKKESKCCVLPDNVPVSVKDFSSVHSMWCLVVSKPLTSF